MQGILTRKMQEATLAAIIFLQIMAQPPPHYKAMLDIAQILKEVVFLVAEVKLRMVFINASEVVMKQ